MIKIENTEVAGWEAAIRGMRNPMNSWRKNDSAWTKYTLDDTELNFYGIGPNDYKLMQQLCKAGSDHRKFMRMIVVYADITAPLYFEAQLDTYKVGTVKNSCSFMHKGIAKEYCIDDFSVHDERIYEILRPLGEKTYALSYPYETDEYKPFADISGHTYRVYRNGLVIREAFDYTDTMGRTRHFDEQPARLYQSANGYYNIKFVGKNSGQMPLHRLVASLWCEKPEGATQVDHINCDKGNNSAENLQWVTPKENMQKAVADGSCANLSSLHHSYRLWKAFSKLIPISTHYEFQKDVDAGMTHNELAEKWGITPNQANNIRYGLRNNENEDLYMLTYTWEKTIENLNRMRALYLETKDDKYFQQLRCLMPQGYNQKATYMLSYEVLHNIYRGRKNHKLDEWHEFCRWIKTLPYSELITGED